MFSAGTPKQIKGFLSAEDAEDAEYGAGPSFDRNCSGWMTVALLTAVIFTLKTQKPLNFSNCHAKKRLVVLTACDYFRATKKKHNSACSASSADKNPLNSNF